MDFKELKNTKNNVINITKTRGIRLFSMMQATSPINSNISILEVKFGGGADRAACGGLTEAKKAIENRAILVGVADFEAAIVLAGVVGRNGLEEIDVVVGMEAAEVVVGGWKRSGNGHMTVEVVVLDEGVGHADTVGLHYVGLAVVVVSDIGVVEVCDSTLFSVRT